MKFFNPLFANQTAGFQFYCGTDKLKALWEVCLKHQNVPQLRPVAPEESGKACVLFMTSVNVVYYTITDLQGTRVGSHQQHLMCKPHWSYLLKFQPVKNFRIKAWGYDEEEEYWEGATENLEDFLETYGYDRTSESFINNKA